MGIVDLEGPQAGSQVFNSERRSMAGGLVGLISLGVILYGLSRFRKKGLRAEDIEVVDDMVSYYH